MTATRSGSLIVALVCAWSGIAIGAAGASEARPEQPVGTLKVCVSGTRGHPAKITITQRELGHRVTVKQFRLSGCRTFADLAPGGYQVRQKAPAGFRVNEAGGGGETLGGGHGVSGVHRSRVSHPKKYWTEVTGVSHDGTSWVDFFNRRHRG